MGYSSASFAIAGDTVYVVNGANVGNAVLKFDLEGNFQEQFAGWFNFPVEVVVGGAAGQVLVSAIGAMNDTGTLRFGMVMYDSMGEFFHGFHEADTGLVRPYGLAIIPGTDGDQVAVADWQGNRTVVMSVDWEAGTMVEVQELTDLPYPWDIEVTEDRLVVAGLVCCEEWHEAMKVVSIFARGGEGELVATIKDLPTGDSLQEPTDVAVSEDGSVLLVSDQGLAATLVFDLAGAYLGTMDGLASPKQLAFHGGLLYSLTCEDNVELEMEECFINVYTYSW